MDDILFQKMSYGFYIDSLYHISISGLIVTNNCICFYFM